MTSSSLVKARFFTTAHQIVGEVETGLKPLSDLLNDKSQSFLIMFDAEVSQFHKPDEVQARVPIAYLAKENLSFVLVPLRETRAPDRSRYTVHQYQAVAIVPRFEIHGKFVGPHRLDLRTFSPAAFDSFLVLTEARAQNAEIPEIVLHSEAILVNRARLECLCLTE